MRSRGLHYAQSRFPRDGWGSREAATRCGEGQWWCRHGPAPRASPLRPVSQVTLSPLVRQGVLPNIEPNESVSTCPPCFMRTVWFAF